MPALMIASHRPTRSCARPLERQQPANWKRPRMGTQLKQTRITAHRTSAGRQARRDNVLQARPSKRRGKGAPGSPAPHLLGRVRKTVRQDRRPCLADLAV